MIVGDTNGDLLLLKDHLEHTPNISTNKLSDANEALVHIRNKECDVLIARLDVLIRVIESDLALPLLVCYNTDAQMIPLYVSRNIFAFMRPPFSRERVLLLMQNIDAYMQQTAHAPWKMDYVFIKSEYKLIRVNLSDIMFLSGLRDYTQVYLKGKTSPLTTLQNLKDFEHKLPEEMFIRVHRSYIVSLGHVDAICRNELNIGTHIIPIGNAYRQVLDEAIARNS